MAIIHPFVRSFRRRPTANWRLQRDRLTWIRADLYCLYSVCVFMDCSGKNLALIRSEQAYDWFPYFHGNGQVLHYKTPSKRQQQETLQSKGRRTKDEDEHACIFLSTPRLHLYLSFLSSENWGEKKMLADGMQCQAKRHNRYKSKAWSKAERSHNHFFLYPAVTHTVGSVQSPVLATTTATVELFNWPLAREQEGRDPLLCFLQTSDHKQWQLARSERNHTAGVADAPGKFTCSPEKVNKRWTGLAKLTRSLATTCICMLALLQVPSDLQQLCTVSTAWHAGPRGTPTWQWQPSPQEP